MQYYRTHSNQIFQRNSNQIPSHITIKWSNVYTIMGLISADYEKNYTVLNSHHHVMQISSILETRTNRTQAQKNHQIYTQ